MKPLTLEEQWQKLLQSGWLPSDAPAIQRQELRNAFYAGAVSLLMQLKHCVSEMPEMDGIAQLNRWEQEYRTHLDKRLREYEAN